MLLMVATPPGNASFKEGIGATLLYFYNLGYSHPLGFRVYYVQLGNHEGIWIVAVNNLLFFSG